MPICAAWLLKHVARLHVPISDGKRSVFMSGRCSLTPILRSPGHGFLVRTRILLLPAAVDTTPATRRDAAKTRFRECSETGAELA